MNDQLLARKLADIYHRVNLIFHAMLAPPLVAFIWLYLESKATSVFPLINDELTRSIIVFTIPIFTVGLVVGAFFFFRFRLMAIRPTWELLVKVKTYSKKAIQFYALLEMSLIFNVLGYYMLQKDVFLIMYMVVLIFFSLYKPTLERIANHLNIKKETRDFVINCRSIARGEQKVESS